MSLTFTPGQFNRRAQFFHQFGQLTAAGVTVVNALELLEKNPPARAYRQPIGQIRQRILEGSTFTDGLESLGRWASAFEIALCRAGEHSGRLDVVCKLLGNYYNERARLLSRTLADMGYPVFVLHFAIFLFPAMTLFNGGTMLGYCFKTFGVLALIYAAVFAFVYAGQSRRGLEWRSFLERILGPVPVLGRARLELALARLAGALEALTNAGVTIVEAWQLAAAASGSPALAREVSGWKPALIAGNTPAEQVKGCSLFPEVFANLYSTGEVSGQLDDTLKRLATYYEEEGTRRLHLLAQWVPRILYFMVAGYVGYRVIHFYMGYFDMLNQI